MRNLIDTLSNPNLSIKEIVEAIFDTTDSDNEVLLPYNTDDISYEISCKLNTKENKDNIFASISNLDKDLEFNQTKTPKDRVVKELLKKNLSFLNKNNAYYNHIVQRSRRVMALYDLNAPKIILNSEIRLLTIAIIMNGCCEVLEVSEVKEEK